MHVSIVEKRQRLPIALFPRADPLPHLRCVAKWQSDSFRTVTTAWRHGCDRKQLYKTRCTNLRVVMAGVDWRDRFVMVDGGVTSCGLLPSSSDDLESFVSIAYSL
jgi:hypothetical protein